MGISRISANRPELAAIRHEKRVSAQEECVRTLFDQSPKGHFDLACGTRIQKQQAQSQSSGRRL
jgi:hypothetical protein